ncbi:hypothetical protein GCM10020295_06790 [Streptomyces cinereospinus]
MGAVAGLTGVRYQEASVPGPPIASGAGWVAPDGCGASVRWRSVPGAVSVYRSAPVGVISQAASALAQPTVRARSPERPRQLPTASVLSSTYEDPLGRRFHCWRSSSPRGLCCSTTPWASAAFRPVTVLCT